MSGFESISECLCEIEEVGNSFADQRRLHCSQVSNHAELEKLTNKLPVKRLRFSVRNGQWAGGTGCKSLKSHVIICHNKEIIMSDTENKSNQIPCGELRIGAEMVLSYIIISRDVTSGMIL